MTDGLKIEESFKQTNDTKHLIESDLVQDSCNFFGVMWTILVSASSLKQAFWLKRRSLLLVCCKNLSILIWSGHVWPNSPNRSRVLRVVRTGHGTMGPFAGVILQWALLQLLPGAAIRDSLKPESLVLDAGARWRDFDVSSFGILRGAGLKLDEIDWNCRSNKGM